MEDKTPEESLEGVDPTTGSAATAIVAPAVTDSGYWAAKQREEYAARQANPPAPDVPQDDTHQQLDDLLKNEEMQEAVDAQVEVTGEEAGGEIYVAPAPEGGPDFSEPMNHDPEPVPEEAVEDAPVEEPVAEEVPAEEPTPEPSDDVNSPPG